MRGCKGKGKGWERELREGIAHTVAQTIITLIKSQSALLSLCASNSKRRL